MGKTEKVVYILGAGFSRPLGLPVMSDFLFKAKDMFALQPERYKDFEKVFKTISELSNIKNYFRSDLFNIEEILSILEMDSYLEGRIGQESFSSFIKEVITYHTPVLKAETIGNRTDWEESIFSRDYNWNLYGAFAGTCMNLRVARHAAREFEFTCNNSLKTEYRIISLNYDMVLENINDYVKTSGENFNSPKGRDLSIAKLHGSVHDDSIVAPTWNKISSNLVEKAWHNANLWLREAEHIRIIGYSLPISDGHVRYLIKSAILKAFNVKNIDVICLDPTGDVKDRYDKFIEFPNFRWKNVSVMKYLVALKSLIKKRPISPSTYPDCSEVCFKNIEAAHEVFMNS